MAHALDGKVLVRTMPRRPFPEYITLAELQKMDLADCTIHNACLSVEVDDPGKTWAAVKVFKSCRNVTFVGCNLANVDQSGWDHCETSASYVQHYKADAEHDNLDRKVDDAGSLTDTFLNGQTVAEVEAEIAAREQ